MSLLDQLPTRLWWRAGRGLAKGNGAMMSLSVPPYLTFEFVEIDFAPGVCALVRPADSSPMREMFADEMAECRRFLAALDEVPDVDGDY